MNYTNVSVVVVTLTTNTIQYDITVPPNTGKIVVQGRANDVKIAFADGDIAGGNFTLAKAALAPRDFGHMAVAPATLFLGSATSGAVAEITFFA